jgi:hypothetical protein
MRRCSFFIADIAYEAKTESLAGENRAVYVSQRGQLSITVDDPTR